MAYDPSIYEGQRRNINTNYTNQSAMNALGRFVSNQRGDRGVADYTQNWQRQTPKFTASYGKRGLAGGGVQSGVYQNAMRNYVGDYQQGVNRMYADQANENNQFDLNQANYAAQKDTALGDLEADKAREIANAAQALTALKGQFS